MTPNIDWNDLLGLRAVKTTPQKQNPQRERRDLLVPST